MNELINTQLQETAKRSQVFESNPILHARFINRSNDEKYYLISFDKESGKGKVYVERQDKFKNAFEDFDIKDWEQNINKQGDCNIERDFNFEPLKFSFLNIEKYNEMVNDLSKEDKEKYQPEQPQEKEMVEHKELFDRPAEQDNDNELSR